METFRQIDDFGVGLNDSEINRYEYKDLDGTLTVDVQTWNAGILTIVFHEVVGIEIYGNEEVQLLREVNGKTPFIITVLNRLYEVIPTPYKEKQYEFFSVNDYPFFKIIASSYTYQFKPYHGLSKEV